MSSTLFWGTGTAELAETSESESLDCAKQTARLKLNKTFREIIVFNDDHVYPEYIVKALCSENGGGEGFGRYLSHHQLQQRPSRSAKEGLLRASFEHLSVGCSVVPHHSRLQEHPCCVVCASTSGSSFTSASPLSTRRIQYVECLGLKDQRRPCWIEAWLAASAGRQRRTMDFVNGFLLPPLQLISGQNLAPTYPINNC